MLLAVVEVLLAAVLILLAAVVAGLVAFNALLARRAEALVPPVGRFVLVDGVRLHYVDEGTGPVVLLIHGLASQLQTFTYAINALLKTRYRLIAVDRPGCGYSQAGSSASLGGQAALFAGLLAALGVERALVVGHSLGGALALALATDHPARVAGVALLAPATQPQGEPPRALLRFAIRNDLIRWVAAWTVAAPLALYARERTLKNLFAPDPVPGDFAGRGGAALAARPASFRNAARDLVEAGGQLAAYAGRYGTIHVPVGVLFGRGDRILDCAVHGEGLRRQIAGAVVELIDEGGHMTPVASPERSAAFIEAMAERADWAVQPAAATGTR